jgi:uncharacterized RDD family membrane protein YckC
VDVTAGVAAPARQNAGMLRRLGATAYEALLLTALVLLAELALLPFVTPAPGEHAGRLYLMSPPARALSGAVCLAVCAVYCVGLWSGPRRTLPMKTWRVALRTRDGSPVSVPTAALRFLACWIGPALAIGAYLVLAPSGHGRWALSLLAFNYLWAWLDADRQWLQDRIAGTRLLAEPRLPTRDAPGS